MLAYVFWHRPYPQTDQKRYEESVVRFQSELARHPSPGFIAASSFRIEPVPWLSNLAGYEDWCLLEGSWAMDPLNAFAIAKPVQPAHDAAAAQMADGAGGIYAHVAGEPPATAQSTTYWLTRPRGIQWQPPLDAIRAQHPEASCWRRQMVLGPATEFAVMVPGDAEIEVPQGWQARRVKRVRLGV